ncbi:hypothetical protein [Sagittula sp. SSi028]|uniref:hypothetical protein n=1 Tax=Sagittula sp. SSi028 TaxID=3400636 RepID=UPI003AF823F3
MGLVFIRVQRVGFVDRLDAAKRDFANGFPVFVEQQDDPGLALAILFTQKQLVLVNLQSGQIDRIGALGARYACWS